MGWIGKRRGGATRCAKRLVEKVMIALLNLTRNLLKTFTGGVHEGLNGVEGF